jgi:hypothetical protein
VVGLELTISEECMPAFFRQSWQYHVKKQKVGVGVEEIAKLSNIHEFYYIDLTLIVMFVTLPVGCGTVWTGRNHKVDFIVSVTHGELCPFVHAVMSEGHIK